MARVAGGASVAATHVWLLLHKKHVEEPSVAYDEAVEEALCWGWIDGLTNRWDERSYAVRFTPRKPAQRLEREQRRPRRAHGRRGPHDAGRQALVDEAKRRGTWDAGGVRPAGRDAAGPGRGAGGGAGRAARWDAWAPTHTAASTPYWVLDAKRAETRARRVAEVVRRAAAGLKPGERG